jgi:hypothetical protein
MRLIRNLLFLIVCSLCASAKSFANTPQLFDKLEYQGQSYSIVISLLARGFSEYGSVEFTSQSSDNHKGYEATWAIRDGVLYLDTFSGWVGRREVSLEDVWPTLKPTPAKAKWVSGEIIIIPGVLTSDFIGRTVDNALSLFFVDGQIIETSQLQDFEIGLDEGGIGVSLAFDAERNVVVEKVFPNSPCVEHSFIKPGVKVMAVQTRGQEFNIADSLSRAIGLIRGSVKTNVTVVFEGQEGKTESLTLTRVQLTKLVRSSLD